DLTLNTFAFIGSSRELLLALDAIREKTKVRILEAPSVLALDGTEAKIVVGGEVPYPAASFVAAAGGSTTSVQYRETGVQRLVVRGISASGTVTLMIAQEVSSVGAPTATGPTFNKTSVNTTLAVKDGETVAIAGLIRDSNNVSKGGIPFLSDVPLFGSLFGHTRRSVARTELLIMITPHVIRTTERFQEISQELKDSLRNLRKCVDTKQKEQRDDIEDARKERYKEDEKRLDERPKKPSEPTVKVEPAPKKNGKKTEAVQPKPQPAAPEPAVTPPP